MLSYTLLHKHLMSLALFILLIHIIDIFSHLLYNIQKDLFFLLCDILFKLLVEHIDDSHRSSVCLLALLRENYFLAASIIIVRAAHQVAFPLHKLKYIGNR